MSWLVHPQRSHTRTRGRLCAAPGRALLAGGSAADLGGSRLRPCTNGKQSEQQRTRTEHGSINDSAAPPPPPNLVTRTSSSRTTHAQQDFAGHRGEDLGRDASSY